jgi:CRP-like cAMP-binding protein
MVESLQNEIMTQARHPTEILKDFRTYPFFGGFSEELLLQVCQMTRSKLFKKGETILREGFPNDSLYFIHSGEVNVVVQNEIVTQLTRRGEVLGEMSLISQQPVSASIHAITDVECYIIDGNDFNLVAEKDQAHFQFLLYKIYSSIAAERLRSTNLKARMAEISNRDLLEAQDELKKMNINLEKLIEERTQQLRQKARELESSYVTLESQNAALTTGFKKLTEQGQIRDATVAKVKSLDQTYLQPLRKTLQSIQDNLSQMDHKSELQSAMAEVQGISLQMRSLIDFFQSEKALESKRVLLIDGEKKQQLVAKMALGGTGVGLDIAGDLESADEFLKKGKYDLIACDIGLSDFMQSAHEQGLNTPIVVFTSTDIQGYLEKLQKLPFVSHVVSRDVNDRNLTVKTILTTINKILTQDFFGLEKYLTWGVDVQECKLTNSGQRAGRIAEMQESFKKIGVRASLLDRCGIVAEEMLMNAIYDAPMDSKGTSLFNHLPRTQEVQLSSDQATTLRYACDGNLIAISVADPFGGLQKKIIFDYLETCYQGNAGTLNHGKGGAGRGLHQIIENSDLTVFNVQSRIRTEVICLINADASAKHVHSSPSFHYFFF